jgi:DNA-binding NarL/FixJ family response regulator
METIQVLIIDEQPIFRAGLRAALSHLDGCRIVGEAIDAQACLKQAREYTPDVALLGASDSAGDLLELAHQLRHDVPRMAVVLLTTQISEEDLFQSIKVGVAAYCTRQLQLDELRETVRRVSHGEYLITDTIFAKPQLASRVLKSLGEREAQERDRGVDATSHSPLSNREIEILDRIAHGNSNKEIAKSLKISDQTVKNHITSILKKLTVTDRTSAVVQALRHGWIHMA